MSDAEIDALERPESWAGVFDDATRAALGLADALCGPDADAVAADLVAELRSHYDETELAELILVCGQANLNNRAGNAAKQLLGP